MHLFSIFTNCVVAAPLIESIIRTAPLTPPNLAYRGTFEHLRNRDNKLSAQSVYPQNPAIAHILHEPSALYPHNPAISHRLHKPQAVNQATQAHSAASTKPNPSNPEPPALNPPRRLPNGCLIRSIFLTQYHPPYNIYLSIEYNGREVVTGSIDFPTDFANPYLEVDLVLGTGKDVDCPPAKENMEYFELEAKSYGAAEARLTDNSKFRIFRDLEVDLISNPSIPSSLWYDIFTNDGPSNYYTGLGYKFENSKPLKKAFETVRKLKLGEFLFVDYCRKLRELSNEADAKRLAKALQEFALREASLYRVFDRGAVMTKIL